MDLAGSNKSTSTGFVAGTSNPSGNCQGANELSCSDCGASEVTEDARLSLGEWVGEPLRALVPLEDPL